MKASLWFAMILAFWLSEAVAQPGRPEDFQLRRELTR